MYMCCAGLTTYIDNLMEADMNALELGTRKPR